MAKTLQNFYKQTLSIDIGAGTGNMYVPIKPTPSSGWIVISPNSSSLREIIAYSSTGTDGTGDYVVMSARGVGGTTAQAHTQGEPVRMNITAEYWADVAADIVTVQDNLNTAILAGAQHASTTQEGIVKLSTAPISPTNPIAVGDNDTRIPSATLLAALAGGGDYGTPSGTNKFLTTDYATANLPVLNVDNKIPATYFDATLLPTPAFEQNFNNIGVQLSSTTNQDGTVFYTSMGGVFKRYLRDTITGRYLLTATITPPQDFTCIIPLGTYLYCFYDNGANMGCYRYDEADLTNQTSMTMSVSMTATFSIPCVGGWTDGTYLYVVINTGTPSHIVYKNSVSGTVISGVTTATPDAEVYLYATSYYFDGTNVYGAQNTSGNNCRIIKLNDMLASTVTVVKTITEVDADVYVSAGTPLSIIKIDSSRVYIGFRVPYARVDTNGTSGSTYQLRLIPIKSS